MSSHQRSSHLCAQRVSGTVQQRWGILQRSRWLASWPFSFSLKPKLALTITQVGGQQNNRALGLACNYDLIFWGLLPRTRSRTEKNRRLGEELTVHLSLDETDSRPHIWTRAIAFQLPSLLACLSLPRTQQYQENSPPQRVILVSRAIPRGVQSLRANHST